MRHPHTPCVSLKLLTAAALVLAAVCPVRRTAAADGANASQTTNAARLYAKHCAQCHGQSGRGDGPRAAQLKARIRSFADCAWMAMRSDAVLFLIIRDGSGAIGLMPEMPAFDGQLNEGQITELVSYIRHFCLDRSAAGGGR